MPRKLGPGALLAPKGETLRTQTFCRRFLIRNSVTFDIALLENFSPNRPSGACESPFKLQGSVWMSQGVGCQGGVTWCHLTSLVKIRFGLFSPRWHCKVLSGPAFCASRTRNEDFFRANEGMAMSFVEGGPGSKEGMTAVFFGMPHWQFNDWAVADGTMQRCCLHSCFNSLHQSLNKCRHNLFPGAFFAFKVDIHPHSFVNSGTMNANFK